MTNGNCYYKLFLPHFHTHIYTHKIALESSKDPATTQEAQNKRLPFLTELRIGRERSPSQDPSITFANPAVTAEFPPPSTNTVTEDVDKHCTEGAIKTGLLSKTSVARREGSRPGPTRHRHFRLTEIALEYLHQFSHVSHRCTM